MDNSIFGNIDDLYLFCRVVDAGSLLRASEIMKLPVSTMSRRLNGLEQRLGIRLLERKGRELTPTENGLDLFSRINNELINTEIELEQVLSAKNEVQGNIRLSLPHTLYKSFIGKLIAHYLLEHPKVTIDIKLNFEDRLPTTDRDLSIGFDLGESSDLIARPFLTSQDALFASKRYIEQFGMPTTLDQLYQKNWVAVRAKRQYHFIKQNNHTTGYDFQPTPKMVVNDLNMLIEAINDGVGIGLVPKHHQKSLSKDVVAVLPEFITPKRHAYLIYKQRVHQPPALSHLVKYLMAHAPISNKTSN
jgi:DNA-binding transcriptional LysR family regulator